MEKFVTAAYSRPQSKKKLLHELLPLSLNTVVAAQRHHLSRGSCGEMQPQHFRKFMGYLLQGQFYRGEWLLDLFHSCWPVQLSCVSDDDLAASVFGKLSAAFFDSVLLLWAVWEAAQLCVMYKLRTPLGKPQETFTSIEGAIKNLARELTGDDTPTQPTSTSLPLEEHVGTWEQRRVRLLLEFLEQLEKTTHNASEGCATALLPAPKPVRTFFHTNKSTCAEWLSRIRGAVIVVALHVGHATTAVRHGHYLLQDLLSNNNTQGTEFEKAVMYVGWALCKLQEPEAIQGLYVWSKEVTGRKFPWLKAATEQAAGRFESSAESYCKLLSTQENSQSEENYVLGFMADQLIECYKAVNNWKELQRWKEKENEMFANQNGGVLSRYILNTMTADHAKALSYFEDGNISLAAELAKWPTDDEISDLSKLDDKIGMNSKSWSSHKLIRDAQHILFNIAITMAAEENFGINNVDRSLVRLGKIMECQLISQCHMQESVRNGSSEFLLQALVMQYSASGLNNILLKKPAEAANTMFQLEDELTVNHASSSTLSEVLWWSKYFGTLTVDSSVQRNIDNLSLNVARAARKEGNLGMAQRFLLKCFSRGESCSNLEELAQSLVRNNAECGPWRIKTYTEVAKLLYSLEKQETAVQVCCLAALNGTDIVKERCSRLLLTLAKWLQHQPQLANKDEPLAKLMFTRDVTLFIEHSLAVKNGTQVIPASDLLVGQLLQSGVSLCPTLAKSWNQLASWCYRWGRRVVDAAIEAGGQLSEADRLAIQHVLPAGTSREDLDRVYAILSQTRAVADEEDIETEDFNTSEMIESQLQSVGALSGATSDQLCYLVDIWRSAQKRVYSYYELSAMAYFKYLELCGEGEHMSKTGECITITATLRLLRLIVKHALELQSVLESGFASTPTRPWKAIIPQLFSRLSHPEAYVRRRVSELLCRVTEDAPHLITFPAVVGAATCGARLRASSTTRLFNTCLSQGSEEANGDSGEDEEEENEDEDEDDEEDSGQVSVLKTCFLAMVDTLSKQAPEAISQVQLLVQELRRITLLWDELWLGTLVQHHAEISRRLAQLDTEVARVEDNVSLSPTDKEILIAEKHRIILKPLVFILEQLHSITSVSPETPHEKFFQEKFGESIAESLQKLKSPINPRRPQESWQPLKQLQARLQQRSQKRAAYSIRMQDVSPALARLSNTVIAMPGVSSVSGKIITIASVDNNIAVLPTKTKPKKLMFHGSDGQIYTYLFKGLEDLHLDERIMQFLNIANTLMWRSGSSGAVYRARHYSVIPLGPRSGLISWVDGVVPLFGLYKRWQQREATSLLLKGQSSSSAQPSSTGAGQVMRPSELFYSKLTPLLKEQGITDLDNRKEWPLPILKQVLTQLMEETPKDLLAKELWCHSVNAGLWWQSTRTYSYSVAVMSIIGYIIGLGDRHLDNVLVDLTTGEVVHIDYNVSFEKGKTLRVPEKVPFRMTPNIKAALGVTGVEGIFRLACEHVLKVMKKGRETLLTLLEAFVYDPLIDWTPGNEAGYTGAVYGGGQAIAMETKQSRKEVEREVTQAMFCVRVAEMKAEWMANRDEILSAMPELFVHLNKWLEVQGLIRSSEESLQDCHQQMALLKEAEASPQHPLYTLADRYSKHCRSRDASEKVRVALKEKIEDCDKHLNLHKVALSSVRGPQLAQWMAELNYPVDKDSHLVFDLVKEFLQNAGKGQMITQCEQSECELGQISQQQVMLVRSCLDLLSQYGTVASMYPASYLASHRSVCYRTWAQRLLNNMSTKSCHEVVAQFQSLFSPKAVASKQQQVITVTYQLQAALADANARLQKSFEHLKVEGLSDSGARLEAAYNDAKVNISKFLCEEKGAALALECVNITALCALNKRYLMMEAAAASAGDCLVDLTSRDGDWFLDEMYLASSLVTELSNLLPLQNQFDVLGSNPVSDSRVDLVLQCLKSAHTIYKGLQELNFNFHTIILPEAVKTIQQEEPTVCFMMQELDDIIQAVGCPLTDLLARLEMHLRYIIMEMDSPHVGCQLVVASLQAQFNSLLQRTADLGGPDDHEEALTPGQMLLMGFNGLFEKLHLDGNALIAALETLETPSCWKKVDQVREAKAMLAPVFNEATRGVLEDIFLIKRLQTMQEFFMLCNQTTRGIGAAYDDDHLNKPIRRFTADYVSRQLLVEVELRDVGAESKVALEELCHKAVDLCMKRGMFTTGTLAQASGLTSNLEATWRRREGASHLQHEVEARRPSFMLELRKTSSALLSLQPRLSEARQQQSALVSSVEQRLKWAAGANPALSEVMAAFDTSVSVRAERLNLEQGLAALVGNTCTALLHHEALRTRTSEALAHDTAFLQLLEQCEKTCQLAVGCDQSVTPQEESLVQMLVPEGPINHVWIQTVEVLISDRIKSLQQQILGLQESLYMAQDCAKNQAMVLRSRLAAHHKLMADVRNLLKSMVKFEECGLVGVHDYLVSYRAYADQFTTLIRDIVNEDLDTEKVHAALTSSEELKQKTMSIYQDLLELSARQQSAGGEGGRLKRPPLIRQDSICFSPKRGLNRDPHTGKAVQERNAYALSVWRRVRMKLEGRDPDPGRRATVQEQVDHVIEEAMSLDNLALLYEGWTPWV
uniref:non-specific serine/threonine protein kinase n=1 Tax=Timema shepardi TaxID=629360 RepID=A0A7R9ANC4_TIMSH|nr:unnamed protein product [Timema shepardi]